MLQGTRQGGVISIDNFLDGLNACGMGFKINCVKLASRTVCDDMLLLALSKFGLNILMQISYRYSCLWRIEFSTPKCSVVVFKEIKSQYNKHESDWYLRPNEVNEAENYKHLGVNCNNYLNLSLNVKYCALKLKGTFMSLANSGLFSELNPLTCIKIYNSVVLPKALYGCESWSQLSVSNIIHLERAHRFCIKYTAKFWHKNTY